MHELSMNSLTHHDNRWMKLPWQHDMSGSNEIAMATTTHDKITLSTTLINYNA